MDLAKVIRPDAVKLPLEAYDKEEAIAELVEVLVRSGRIGDREGVLQALYDREAREARASAAASPSRTRNATASRASSWPSA